MYQEKNIKNSRKFRKLVQLFVKTSDKFDKSYCNIKLTLRKTFDFKDRKQSKGEMFMYKDVKEKFSWKICNDDIQ